jgi:hypothetical protein
MTNRLDLFARRLSNDRTFLASALQAFAASEGLDSAGLAAYLGCEPHALGRLGLCRRPRDDRFAQDVDAIAERFALPPDILAGVVRRAEVLEALRAAESEAEVMAAARDRREDDER